MPYSSGGADCIAVSIVPTAAVDVEEDVVRHGEGRKIALLQSGFRVAFWVFQRNVDARVWDLRDNGCVSKFVEAQLS